MIKLSVRSILKHAPDRVIEMARRIAGESNSVEKRTLFDIIKAPKFVTRDETTRATNLDDFAERASLAHKKLIEGSAFSPYTSGSKWDFQKISPAHKKYYEMRSKVLEDAGSDTGGATAIKNVARRQVTTVDDLTGKLVNKVERFTVNKIPDHGGVTKHTRHYDGRLDFVEEDVLAIGTRLSKQKESLSKKFGPKEVQRRLTYSMKTLGFENTHPVTLKPEVHGSSFKASPANDLLRGYMADNTTVDPSAPAGIIQAAAKHIGDGALHKSLLSNVVPSASGQVQRKLVAAGDATTLTLHKKHYGSHNIEDFAAMRERMPKDPKGNMSENTAQMLDDMITHDIDFKELGVKPKGEDIRRVRGLVEVARTKASKDKFVADFPAHAHRVTEPSVDLGGGLKETRGHELSGLSGSSCWGNVCISSPHHKYMKSTLEGTHSIFEFINPKNAKNRALIYAKKLPDNKFKIEEARGPNNSTFEKSTELQEALSKHRIEF